MAALRASAASLLARTRSLWAAVREGRLEGLVGRGTELEADLGGAGGAGAVAESRKGNPKDKPLEGLAVTEI